MSKKKKSKINWKDKKINQEALKQSCTRAIGGYSILIASILSWITSLVFVSEKVPDSTLPIALYILFAAGFGTFFLMDWVMNPITKEKKNLSLGDLISIGIVLAILFVFTRVIKEIGFMAVGA